MHASSVGSSPHVCFVNSLRGFGGAELWFLETVQSLRARGIRASLVAQPDSRLLAAARAANLPCAAIAIRCDGAPWTLWRLWRHFRREAVTALVCNLTKDLKAGGLAGRWAGVAVRLASRESDFPLKSSLHYRWYWRRAATGVLVNSEATRRTTLASAPWLDPARVHLLYKGVDTGRYQPSGPPPSGRPRVVGFVGQLIERKGLPTLMAAWEQLLGEDGAADPPLRLRLAGEGPLHPVIERWRAALPRPDSVELCGFVADVPGFWAGCRVAVQPSLAEGFGLAAAEASACGLPVVAARASSLPEVVLDGRTGLLVEPARPQALAHALDRLLRDDALVDQLGLAGRQHIVDRFDHEQCLQELVRLVCPEEGP
jgi:glycosyltransferase involved in cell wall biosynthesis